MPIYINNGNKATPPKKAPDSLKTINRLLTGRPDTLVGWFNSNVSSVEDKIKKIDEQIMLLSSDPDKINVSYTSFQNSKEIFYDLTKLDHNNSMRIKANISQSSTNGPYQSSTNGLYDAYLLGFSKITARVDDKSTSSLVPLLYFRNTVFSDSTSDVLIDSKIVLSGSLTTLVCSLLSSISMKELYDHAMKYYFQTDFSQFLIGMPGSKTATNYSADDHDAKLLNAYQIFMSINKHLQLSNKTLARFTHTLMLNSPNKSMLKQLLLQTPELSFASLSTQFADKAKTFDLL